VAGGFANDSRLQLMLHHRAWYKAGRRNGWVQSLPQIRRRYFDTKEYYQQYAKDNGYVGMTASQLMERDRAFLKKGRKEGWLEGILLKKEKTKKWPTFESWRAYGVEHGYDKMTRPAVTAVDRYFIGIGYAHKWLAQFIPPLRARKKPIPEPAGQTPKERPAPQPRAPRLRRGVTLETLLVPIIGRRAATITLTSEPYDFTPSRLIQYVLLAALAARTTPKDKPIVIEKPSINSLDRDRGIAAAYKRFASNVVRPKVKGAYSFMRDLLRRNGDTGKNEVIDRKAFMDTIARLYAKQCGDVEKLATKYQRVAEYLLEEHPELFDDVPDKLKDHAAQAMIGTLASKKAVTKQKVMLNRCRYYIARDDVAAKARIELAIASPTAKETTLYDLLVPIVADELELQGRRLESRAAMYERDLRRDETIRACLDADSRVLEKNIDRLKGHIRQYVREHNNRAAILRTLHEKASSAQAEEPSLPEVCTMADIINITHKPLNALIPILDKHKDTLHVVKGTRHGVIVHGYAKKAVRDIFRERKDG
jgi:hypothetical protein